MKDLYTLLTGTLHFARWLELIHLIQVKANSLSMDLTYGKLLAERTLPLNMMKLYYYSSKGAIIVGEYKLIVGTQSDHCDALMYSPLDYPCSNRTLGSNCDPYCLYNIVKDPGKTQDLTITEPDILKMMLDRYNSHAKEDQDMMDQGYHSDNLPVYKDACTYMAEHGGKW